VILVFDSARFDHVKMAKTRWLKKLGKLERRFSYTSWTPPSHFALLMGQMPHRSLRRTLVQDAYYEELIQWRTRLGVKNVNFGLFLPSMSLPKMLKAMGYQTHGIVSMPILNMRPAMSHFFDKFEVMPRHNDFPGILSKLKFDGPKPRFYFINVGETHYPYTFGSDSGPAKEYPWLHGWRGAIQNINDGFMETGKKRRWFPQKVFAPMKNRQIECIEYLDAQIEKLYSICPGRTHIIITSDHGELFGEDGYYGHGPICHEKVFEIPFIEGRVPE
jgi:arylsulfatase A-like enzyme